MTGYDKLIVTRSLEDLKKVAHQLREAKFPLAGDCVWLFVTIMNSVLNGWGKINIAPQYEEARRQRDEAGKFGESVMLNSTLDLMDRALKPIREAIEASNERRKRRKAKKQAKSTPIVP